MQSVYVRVYTGSMTGVRQKTSTARIYVTDRAHISALQDAFEIQDGQRPTEQQVIHWAIRALEDQRDREQDTRP
jgi:hypothetical protein